MILVTELAAAPIEQLRHRPNVDVALGAEVKAAHGDDPLKAIDVVDRATGEGRRLESGGVFVFIGARRRDRVASPGSGRATRTATC